MMINCSKCGRQLGVNDRFCPDCGERVVLPANEGSSRPNGGPSQKRQSQPAGGTNAQRQSQPAGGTNAGQSSVRYVYVDKKTGKITDSPNSKKGADGCLSFLGVALVAVAVVIAMVAGAVLISSQFSGRSGFSSEDEWSFTEESDQMISSQEVSSSVSSVEPVSSEVVSSEPVSSEETIPEELLAVNLQKKIKGKWRTDVPYKNMTLPGTFEFDGKAKCKFTITAFLFSKKFSGTYQIRDGGECELTLDGIDEYLDDDTMTGDLSFITDDKIEFTVGDTVWKLNRVE